MQNISTQYENYMVKIEDLFSGSEVPMDVQMFYLLASLIATQSFKKFSQRYGLIQIDADFANVGKVEWLNLGPLTQFEHESCALWNRYCVEAEKHSDQRKIYLTHN